jgi:uncharacterized protein involved in response to NO
LTPFLSYGFRPFFLGAALSGVLSVALWLGFFHGHVPIGPAAASLSPMLWHAHEMLFGYSLAVIAGFLLTAVRNWTQLPGVDGRALAWIFALWLVPRLLLAAPLQTPVLLAAAFDLAFITCLILSVGIPIAKSGQARRQAGIVSKLCLLGASHLAFYWAVYYEQAQWLLPSLYSALYLIVALCLTLARRLIPFFVKSTAGLELPVSNGLDRASLLLFFTFWLAVIWQGHTTLTAVLALGLCVTHAGRLWQWRSRAILRAPLLWVLYAGYAFFILGFALVAALPLLGIPLSLAIHAFAVGGIGTLTIGMMARVAWGHTGRPIKDPPWNLTILFLLMIAAGVVRVVGPLIAPAWYSAWILLAGVGWIAAFAGFIATYLPVLTGPRPDA